MSGSQGVNENSDLSDKIIRRLQSGSARAKPLLFREELVKEQPQKLPLPLSNIVTESVHPVEQKPRPEATADAERVLLDSFAQILDSKLTPIDNALNTLQAKLIRLEHKPFEKSKNNAPSYNELMKTLEARFDKFFSETYQQTHTTISEGIQYYNQGLAEREQTYAREHEAATQSFIQANKGLIDIRSKQAATGHDRATRAIAKLRETMVENGQNLEKVSAELDKVTLYLERCLDAKQRQKMQEEAYQDEIDPEDLIELDEDEIVQILMDNFKKVQYGPIMPMQPPMSMPAMGFQQHHNAFPTMASIGMPTFPPQMMAPTPPQSFVPPGELQGKQHSNIPQRPRNKHPPK